MKWFPLVRSNILTWVIGFGIWFLWELAVRVLLYHPGWGLTQIFPFTWINLAFGLSCGLVLGILHTLLLLLFEGYAHLNRFRKWITPTPAVVLSALMGFMVLIPYRTFAVYHTALSVWERWVSAILILLLAYVFCLFWAQLLSRVLKPWGRSRIKQVLHVLFMIPILILICFPAFKKSRSNGTAKGPIRYVVLISIDTARYDFIGAYGVRPVQTPVMNRIASDGVLFREAISSIPVTGPSHISMLTGQPPLVHGVRFNGQPLSNKVLTVTSVLRDAGFQTGGFISGYPLKVFESGLDRGFQVYDDHLVYTDLFSETYFGRLAEFLPFFPRGLLRLASEVTDKAVGWLNKRDGSPFFLFLHYYDPHYPYGSKEQLRHNKNILTITARPEDLERQTRLYASEIEKVDQQIARVIEVLKKKGFYDRTLLIVTADHGESLGEHHFYYTHAYHVYEQLLRVPLIIRCPVLVRPGSEVTQPVALFDIAKTILESVGLNQKMMVSGVNLISLAHQVPPNYNRSIVSHNFESHVHAIRSANWKLIRNENKAPVTFELYDLNQDPLESRNLLESERSIAVELQRRLTAILQSPGSNAVDWTVKDLSAEQIEKLRSLGYFN
jgi:arylsulfatase A-like enzyme